MASCCDTSTDEGTKSANDRLKLAAGIISYLKTSMTDVDFRSPDFSEEALNYYQFLILAQSQNITIDGAIRRKLGDEMLSKLCQGAVELYNEAVNSCVILTKNKKVDNDMLKYCLFHK